MTLPGGPNDMNLYAALIALGVGLVACLWARYSNRFAGTRPVGDVLSWFVHTRCGHGSKSWLAKKLDLNVILGATVGEVLISTLYIGWLTIRFAYFIERNATAPTVAVRVGRAFGELGPPMVLMEYLLAQRYTIWGWVAGIPHERLIGYHRINGWALYWVLTGHMVCMAVAMRQRIMGFPIVRQIDDAPSIKLVNPALGVASYILFTFTVLATLEFLRRSWWGMFYVSHFSFFPAVVLALFHNRNRNLPWFAASAGFFYIDAGIRFYMKFMRNSKVISAEQLPGGVAKLIIQTGASMHYHAGQYVWIAFPDLPNSPEWVTSFSFHPYSISSAYKPGDETYNLHIKSMGPGTWSEAVVNAAKGGKDAFPSCRVGGPCGRFAVNPEQVERIVLVAGGIGVTPLVSLLTDIVQDAEGANKAGATRRFGTVQRVTFIWAVPSASCLTWFTEELQVAQRATAVTVDLQLFVTRKEEKDAEKQSPPPLTFNTGRPNILATLEKAAESAAGDTFAGTVGVYACGPEPMLDETHRAVAAANGKAGGAITKKFLLHTEVFLF